MLAVRAVAGNVAYSGSGHFQGQKVKFQGHQATLLSADLTREAGAAVTMGL